MDTELKPNEKKDMKESQLFFEIQKQLERNESERRADLINRYTSEDLVKAWTAGYLVGTTGREEEEQKTRKRKNNE